MPEVTCIGLLVADIVGKPVDEFPERGKLQLLNRIELHSGGCAANAGIALAKLGVDTAIIGKVGNDGFGDFLVQQFEAYGMNAKGVARDSVAATSSTIVLGHSDGERSFLHYMGANGTFCLDDIDFGIVRNSKVVHIAGSFVMPAFDGEPTAELLRRAQEAGVITVFDSVWDPSGEWLNKVGGCMPYVDYLLPSYEEARMFAGGRDDPSDIAKFLLDTGPKVVGIKLGEQGAYLRTADGLELRAPAFKVAAIDSLGAGDSWVAGFLAALTRGWELEKCLRFGNAVGACCVTALGATTGIRSFTETEQFLSQYNRQD